MHIFLLAFTHNGEDECEISDLKFIKKKDVSVILLYNYPTINAIKTIKQIAKLKSCR